MENDHYQILGVAPDSDDVVVRAAYKALMLKYHPDTNAGSDATTRSIAINAAFSVLGDPKKRAEYDRARAAERVRKSRSRSSRRDSPTPPPSGMNQSEGQSPSAISESAWYVSPPFVVISSLALLLFFTVTIYPAASGSSPVFDYSTADMISNDTMNNADTTMGISKSNASNSLDLLSDVLDKGNDLNQSQTTLTGPPPPLDFNVIENAANVFDKTLEKRGILGARNYSERCHASAIKTVDWSKYDFCVAYDFAAGAIDSSFSDHMSFQRNAYFSFMNQNAADQYKATGLSYIIGQRVQIIRSAATAAVSEALEARLARNKIAQESSAPKEGDTSQGNQKNSM